jgi:hypothetical protein
VDVTPADSGLNATAEKASAPGKIPGQAASARRHISTNRPPQMWRKSCPSWVVEDGVMTIRVLGSVLVVAALTIAPAHAWQVTPEEHAKHHPEAQAGKAAPAPQAKSPGMKGMDMMASSAKLDELVKKMNAAQGQVKVDAMAELLTALVQQHQSMHGNMAEMMSKMQNKDAGTAK